MGLSCHLLVKREITADKRDGWGRMSLSWLKAFGIAKIFLLLIKSITLFLLLWGSKNGIHSRNTYGESKKGRYNPFWKQLAIFYQEWENVLHLDFVVPLLETCSKGWIQNSEEAVCAKLFITKIVLCWKKCLKYATQNICQLVISQNNPLGIFWSC